MDVYETDVCCHIHVCARAHTKTQESKGFIDVCCHIPGIHRIFTINKYTTHTKAYLCQAAKMKMAENKTRPANEVKPMAIDVNDESLMKI